MRKTIVDNIPEMRTRVISQFIDILRSNSWGQDTGKVFQILNDLYCLKIMFWSVIITSFT